jgi:oligosaccharide reducing-end xylanase
VVRSVSLIACLAIVQAGAAGLRAQQGAYETGRYRNLFHEYLGKTEAETDAKLDRAWRQMVVGDSQTQRLIYPAPGDMAYVPDVANNDVRTEGLSYGMMISVQLDHKDEFNRIWRFAREHLYHDSGPMRGYFAWHASLDGSPLSPGPAPDGEEWFTMALFFASHRWGDGAGIFNYGSEAQAILHTMLHKAEENGPVGNMFNAAKEQVVFAPDGAGAGFTDPSYHLPAFYELWARWAASAEDRAFLAGAARASRQLFRNCANPRTGLMPDYSNFDGTPHAARGHEDFRFDAWRTLSNPALDYSWWAADPWEVDQANRILSFLASQGANCPDLYRLDGRPVSAEVNSAGLAAMAGAAALAADESLGRPFVRRLWELDLPEGHYRYYGGMLTVLGLLEAGGRFRIYGPPAAR